MVRTISVSKPATRDFGKLPKYAQKAFTTYINETLKKGEPSTLEVERFKSVHSSVVEVKVKGQPAGRMFYTKVGEHYEILAFAKKSRFGQDPQIKDKVEQRLKAFQQNI